VSATVWSDMRIGAALSRIPRGITFWALAGVALLVSHDAVFLVQLGPGEELTRALRAAGHDYWGWASLALLGIGVAAGSAALLRLRSLRKRVERLRAAPAASRTALAGRFAATWVRMLGVVVIGFALQENVEHVISHGHAIGLGALLGPEYPLALPVIGLITAVAGLIAAAVQRTERELVSIIHAALWQRKRRPMRVSRPPLHLALPRLSPLALEVAGRAPPRAFAALH
jgi:hypothetical protein